MHVIGVGTFNLMHLMRNTDVHTHSWVFFFKYDIFELDAHKPEAIILFVCLFYNLKFYKHMQNLLKIYQILHFVTRNYLITLLSILMCREAITPEK